MGNPQANVPFENHGSGKILVVCAGTSDLPVAQEAAVTARMFDCFGAAFRSDTHQLDRKD
jgi:NCAIR mutase (PurE)-related protein